MYLLQKHKLIKATGYDNISSRMVNIYAEYIAVIMSPFGIFSDRFLCKINIYCYKYFTVDR